MRRALWMCAIGLGACGGGGEPTSGTWLYENVAISEDTCNSQGQISDPGGEFFLKNNGDGTFTVDPNDGTDIFDCSLDGKAFDCPERLVEEAQDSDFDITLTVNGTAEGEITSEKGSGQQIGTVDCSGSGCATASALFGTTFPCTVVWDFEITFVDADLGDEL